MQGSAALSALVLAPPNGIATTKGTYGVHTTNKGDVWLRETGCAGRRDHSLWFQVGAYYLQMVKEE